jgi:hypothetical protein
MSAPLEFYDGTYLLAMPDATPTSDAFYALPFKSGYVVPAVQFPGDTDISYVFCKAVPRKTHPIFVGEGVSAGSDLLASKSLLMSFGNLTAVLDNVPDEGDDEAQRAVQEERKRRHDMFERDGLGKRLHDWRDRDPAYAAQIISETVRDGRKLVAAMCVSDEIENLLGSREEWVEQLRLHKPNKVRLPCTMGRGCEHLQKDPVVMWFGVPAPRMPQRREDVHGRRICPADPQQQQQHDECDVYLVCVPHKELVEKLHKSVAEDDFRPPSFTEEGTQLAAGDLLRVKAALGMRLNRYYQNGNVHNHLYYRHHRLADDDANGDDDDGTSKDGDDE